MSVFDTSDVAGEHAPYFKEIERLEMSNQRLIAELGRIAEALGVEPSMVKVLGKIQELQDRQVEVCYRSRHVIYSNKAAAEEDAAYYNGQPDDVVPVFKVSPTLYYEKAYTTTSTHGIKVFSTFDDYLKAIALGTLTPRQKVLLGLQEKE